MNQWIYCSKNAHSFGLLFTNKRRQWHQATNHSTSYLSLSSCVRIVTGRSILLCFPSLPSFIVGPMELLVHTITVAFCSYGLPALHLLMVSDMMDRCCVSFTMAMIMVPPIKLQVGQNREWKTAP